MKKWIAIIVATIIGAAAAFVVIDRLLGTNRLETWIANVVVGVANSYLVPTISYETIAYTAPASVDLAGVAFTAPDGTRIIEIQAMQLALAEIPRAGRPLIVERVVISDGTINLIRDEETGGIHGLIPLLESNLSDEYRTDTGEPLKLSESLRLREIVIENVNVSYDDGSGTPLVLDDLNLHADIAPDEVDGHPGWYALKIDITRGESIQIHIPGHLNLDTLVAHVEEGTVDVDLNEDSLRSLPSGLQQFLATRDAQGSLTINVNGFLPLSDPVNGLLTLDVDVESFRLTEGDFTFPIESLSISAGLADGMASVSDLRVDALGGAVRADALVPLSNEPARASWNVENLDLSQLMSAQATDKPSRLAGLLTTSGEATAVATDLPASVGGGGELAIRKGRLMMMPGLQQLASVMNIVITGEMKPNHKLDAEFDFTPEGIHVKKSEVLTGFLAARAQGLIDYEGMMDLTVNAGPLERLQSVLGTVGDVFGQLTDQIMAYHVRGPVAKPTVSASIGRGKRAGTGDASEEPPTDDPAGDPSGDPSGDPPSGDPPKDPPGDGGG